jgi:tRNA modification GTPase
VLAGPPNAGKSSLLNALSGSDRAIVTSVPGTTRDLLHADIEIDGLPLRIVDTAGFRRAADPVEREGLRRAREQIERADLVLWIIDDAAQEQEAGESGSPTSATDQGFPDGVPVLLVRNKIDLSGRPSGPVRESPQGQTLACSAETGAGLDALRTALQQHAGISAEEGGEFSARRRHLDALKRTRAHLSAALDTSTDDAPPELAAEDLRLAQQALGEITGIVSSDDLLGKIFSEFCIGK